jgi:hypothetical protein
MKTARNYCSSSVRYGRADGALLLEVSGTLSDRDWSALNDDTYVQARKYESSGLVLKLDRSDVDISGDIALRQLQELANIDPATFRPGAFVVAKRDLGLFREMAWQMATMGIVAAVFTNSDDAANFALRKGEVWSAELAFRWRQAAQYSRE